ncbi:MAG TPA: alpha/beta fold hydrolase [Candidatus Thermoplasmatota archaeon]|nr:alpha/beta fold hydrolase [Candidatus Thermoplasmatota archaeon]
MPSIQTFFRILDGAIRFAGVRRRAMAGPPPLSFYEAGARHERTVVLVHGLGTSGISWVKVLRPLARRFHVLAPDLPGWGWSPLPQGKDHATIHELRDALITFLEKIARKPVVLVGQSLGGWVSAKVAASRPDLVERLVLTNSAGVLYPEVAELKAKLDVRSPEQVDAFWRDMYHRVPWFYRYFSDDYVAKMHEPRILNFFESIQEESTFVNDDLQRITMPTTILWGLSDRFLPRSTVDVLVAGLPDVKVYWIPDCGHIPALERPREFVRIVLGELGDQAA